MAHQISRIITIGTLIVACTLASACGSTVGAADEDRSAQQSAPKHRPIHQLSRQRTATASTTKATSCRTRVPTSPQNQHTKASITRPATRTTGTACTDVVGAALRGAGYDLMTLVHEDILAHPERYAIDTPDANIDFRRVPVLNAYFAAHAINLTTDTTDVGAWQGGTSSSTAITSALPPTRATQTDCRCSSHHVSAEQKQYEEDVLGTFPGSWSGTTGSVERGGGMEQPLHCASASVLHASQKEQGHMVSYLSHRWPPTT